MKEVTIRKVTDPITVELEGLITIYKPKYNWFYFKWLQLKELSRNVWTNIIKRLYERKYFNR